MPLIKGIKLIKSDAVVGFECDCCKTKFSKESYAEFDERIEISFNTGYGSVWGDGKRVGVVLCQRCGLNLLEPFAVVRRGF